MNPLIEVQGLCVQRGSRRVLDRVDLLLHEGERLLIDGPSGAGKSTLLHALLGFVPKQAGHISLLGQRCELERDFATRRGTVGLLFQDPDDQLLGPSVFEDAEFGPLNQGLSPARAHQLAHQALEQLGIHSLADRPVHALSGGEKRLAALAGVLAMQPRLLLLDEPTTGLDETSAHRLLQALLATGLPLLLASHDPLCRRHLASRRVHLHAGRLEAPAGDQPPSASATR